MAIHNHFLFNLRPHAPTLAPSVCLEQRANKLPKRQTFVYSRVCLYIMAFPCKSRQIWFLERAAPQLRDAQSSLRELCMHTWKHDNEATQHNLCHVLASLFVPANVANVNRQHLHIFIQCILCSCSKESSPSDRCELCLRDQITIQIIKRRH